METSGLDDIAGATVVVQAVGAATPDEMIRHFPMLDPLRADPRFEKVVASLAPKN